MKDTNYLSIESFQLRADLLKTNMLESGLARPDLIKGCSEQEILELAKKSNVIFPNSYTVFLKNFGYGLGGRIMADIDITYDKILPLTNLLRNEVLIDEGDPCLPEKAFVFAARYGEQFMFFDASGLVEEPTLFYYMENESKFTKVEGSIFDILERSVEAFKKYK
jgi:hypothetical protein